ncbi:MAG: hypothetical protein J0H40_05815 [Rhizobiales bacterium]|nr:hypothetical protein [Hyphomicrobiales bacterium]
MAVPAHLITFMGKREIKFSLGTADPDLARIRFQGENAKLERLWHEHLNGRQHVMLSQRQISALAGEFYREMVAAHRDDPGHPLHWELVLKQDREKIGRRVPLIRRKIHMRMTFSSLARHVDMHVDIQSIIQGHAGDKVASDYGDAWIETAYREIMKIPKYDLK